MLVLIFSMPVCLIDEVLKFFGRIKNEIELKSRMEEFKAKKV